MAVPVDAILLSLRTRLRAPSKADLPYIWSATRVAGFNDGLLWDPPENFEDLDAPLERALERWSRGIAYQWTIEDRAGRAFLGRIAVTRTENLDEWMLGFWIHPEHQREGYATEAAKVVVDFAFEHLGARVIVAAHATWNVASGKVLAAIGMRKVRTNPKGFKKANRWVEEYEYELHKLARA